MISIAIASCVLRVSGCPALPCPAWLGCGLAGFGLVCCCGDYDVGGWLLECRKTGAGKKVVSHQ